VNDKQPLVLSVHIVGSAQFPRWIISDPWLRYYDGEGWTMNQAMAVRFASSNEACVEVQRLQMSGHEERQVRRYRTSVYLDLFADKEISLDELKEWAFRVSKLVMDPAACGLGPKPETLGNISIEWSELEQINEEGA